MSRDLLNESTVKQLVPATNSSYELELAGSLSVNGASVDLIGEGRKCLLIVDVNTTSSATFSLKVMSGTDDVTFGTTEYDGGEILATGVTIVDFEATNRYIRAEYVVDNTGVLVTHTFVSFAVEVVVYNERYRPSNVA